MNERLVAEVLAAFPSAQAVYVFGSAAAGEMRPDSDVDVAVLLPQPLARAAGDLTLSPLAFDLMRALKRDVHVVNLRLASTVLQAQVITYGEVAHSADDAARQTFEMIALSLYQKLGEERAGIVNDLRERKRIYEV